MREVSPPTNIFANQNTVCEDDLKGSEPEKNLTEQAVREHNWIRYTRPKFDEAKVPYVILSKLVLMPDLVGPAVLDASTLEVPLVTTAVPYHTHGLTTLKPVRTA